MGKLVNYYLQITLHLGVQHLMYLLTQNGQNDD